MQLRLGVVLQLLNARTSRCEDNMRSTKKRFSTFGREMS